MTTISKRHTPLVSVMLPTRNCEQSVQEAVSSILGQSLEDFELLIMDDASTDKTWEILSSIKDQRIRLYKNEQRLGVGETANKLFTLAAGSFMARMDAAAVNLPHRLQAQVDWMNEHRELWACSGSYISCLGGERERWLPSTHEDIKASFLFSNSLAQPFMMFRADIWKRHNLTYDAAVAAEDYDLWVKIITRHPEARFGNVPLILGHLPAHHDSTADELPEARRNSIFRSQRHIFKALGIGSFDKDIAIHKFIYPDIANIHVESDVLDIFRWMNKLLEANFAKHLFQQGIFLNNIIKKLYSLSNINKKYSRRIIELSNQLLCWERGRNKPLKNSHACSGNQAYGKNIKLYYWKKGGTGNFGDELSPYIVHKITGLLPEHVPASDPEKLCAVGSLFGDDTLPSGGTFWGTGTHFSALSSNWNPQAVSIKAVRGPVTRKILTEAGYNCPDIFGDPALLLPMFYQPKTTKEYKLGIIPHYLHQTQIRIAPDIKFIDIMRDFNEIEMFIDEVNKCEAVLSSSLHGIIVANAYGVPARYFTVPEVNIGGDPGIKFLDYFMSVKMPPQRPVNFNKGSLVRSDIFDKMDKTVDLKINLKALLDAFPG